MIEIWINQTNFEKITANEWSIIVNWLSWAFDNGKEQAAGNDWNVSFSFENEMNLYADKAIVILIINEF